MDSFTITDLKLLLAYTGERCVSVYLPTHPTGEERRQDIIRLKNLATRAEQQLVEIGLRPVTAREILKPVRDLYGEFHFWESRDVGLAMFLAADFWQCFRLPLAFEDKLQIGDRFHIRPLIPLLQFEQDCFVLALSQNQVHCYVTTGAHIEQVEIAGLPASRRAGLDHDQPQQVSQAHSAGKGRGKQAAVFHGQGGRPDEHKLELEQFCRMVDAALQPMLRQRPAPLILAGVQFVTSIYRGVNKYDQLMEGQIEGNADHLKPHELRRQAWPLIKEYRRRAVLAQLERYHAAVASGKTSDQVEQIIPAAVSGRVESLFLVSGAEIAGQYDKTTGHVETRADGQAADEDLADLAVVETLRHGGSVFIVDPADLSVPLAAQLRYATD